MAQECVVAFVVFVATAAIVATMAVVAIVATAAARGSSDERRRAPRRGARRKGGVAPCLPGRPLLVRAAAWPRRDAPATPHALRQGCLKGAGSGNEIVGGSVFDGRGWYGEWKRCLKGGALGKFVFLADETFANEKKKLRR